MFGVASRNRFRQRCQWFPPERRQYVSVIAAVRSRRKLPSDVCLDDPDEVETVGRIEHVVNCIPKHGPIRAAGGMGSSANRGNQCQQPARVSGEGGGGGNEGDSHVQNKMRHTLRAVRLYMLYGTE